MENSIERIRECLMSIKIDIERIDDELILANQLLEKQLIKVTKGYNLLLDFWEYIPDDAKIELDRQLRELGIE